MLTLLGRPRARRMTRRDHLGRLIDHVHLVVRDIEASRRFYRAVLGAIGLELSYEAAECFACDELFVSSAREVGAHSTGPHRVHLAFQAADRDAVARFHAAALAAGGRDNGGVGERAVPPRLLRRVRARSRRQQHRGRAPRPRRPRRPRRSSSRSRTRERGVIRIVLFDLGDVVARWDPTPRLAEYARRSGLSVDEVRRRLAQDDFWEDTDRGVYSADEMHAQICARLGVAFTRDELLGLQAMAFRIQPDVLRIAQDLAARDSRRDPDQQRAAAARGGAAALPGARADLRADPVLVRVRPHQARARAVRSRHDARSRSSRARSASPTTRSATSSAARALGWDAFSSSRRRSCAAALGAAWPARREDRHRHCARARERSCRHEDRAGSRARRRARLRPDSRRLARRRAGRVAVGLDAVMGGDHALCEIESRPSDPHSIQLDCFTYEGSLYVQSHRWAQASWWPVKSWAVVWLEHPDVRVRIGDSLYDLQRHAGRSRARARRDPRHARLRSDPRRDRAVPLRAARLTRAGVEPADLVPLAHGVDQERAGVARADRVDGEHGLLDLAPLEQVTPKRAGQQAARRPAA